MTNITGRAVPRAQGYRRAGLKIAVLGGVYLLLVIVIVTIEVTSGSTSLLGWAFLICSVAYGVGVGLVCFSEIEGKHIALACVAGAVPLGWLAAIVIGVNVKLLIGGHL